MLAIDLYYVLDKIKTCRSKNPMARDCSTKYHGMAQHLCQKQWTIKRSTVDKFDGQNKFLMGISKPKILET